MTSAFPHRVPRLHAKHNQKQIIWATHASAAGMKAPKSADAQAMMTAMPIMSATASWEYA